MYSSRSLLIEELIIRVPKIKDKLKNKVIKENFAKMKIKSAPTNGTISNLKSKETKEIMLELSPKITLMKPIKAKLKIKISYIVR